MLSPCAWKYVHWTSRYLHYTSQKNHKRGNQLANFWTGDFPKGGGGPPFGKVSQIFHNFLMNTCLSMVAILTAKQGRLGPKCFFPFTIYSVAILPPPPFPLKCISHLLFLPPPIELYQFLSLSEISTSVRGAAGLSWEENWTENRVYFQITFQLSHSWWKRRQRIAQDRIFITCLLPQSTWTKR